MMSFKSLCSPKPAKGQDYRGVKVLTVPNQAMTLEEILTRFVRGEALNIGREVNYYDSDDDLEKVAKGDLTERDEFVEKQRDIQKRWEKQEKEKAKKVAEEEREKIREQIRQEEAAKAAKATPLPTP